MSRLLQNTLRSLQRQAMHRSNHAAAASSSSSIASIAPTLSSACDNVNVNVNATTVTSTLSCNHRRCFSTDNKNGNEPAEANISSVNSTLTDEEAEAEINAAIAELEEEERAKEERARNWKPGYRKKTLVFSHNLEDFENEGKFVSWQPQLHARCGALGIKVGMMPIWDEWGERHACTALYLDHNVVMKNFTEDKDGYTSVQIGAGERKAKNVTKPLMGHYTNCGLSSEAPPYIVREFRVTHDDYLLEPGTQIHARHFLPGQNVDVSATSKGKGFQGAMKKWNFSGMPATHGTSLSHRALGSTGQCQDPGRVFKGKKMAGRMGGNRVTTQNLRIVKIDRGRNIIYLKGPVPGQKGEFVEIRDAVKKPLFGTEKVEGKEVFPPLPTFDYEDGVDGSGKEGHVAMMPLQEIDPFDPPAEEAV